MAADIDLLVLGDANPDLILLGGDVVPAFGQAEHLVDDARLTMGGSGAILACGAAKLGLRVAICALVGDDLFGRYVREGLESAGVETSGIAVDQEAATGVTSACRGRRSGDHHDAGHDRRAARRTIDPSLLGARDTCT